MIAIQDVSHRQGMIFKALEIRRHDLARYAKTIADLHMTNVSMNAEYQRNFNGLYGVRRNAQWRGAYYNILEDRKNDSELSILAVITAILASTGRVEASFASKLIATINPNRAVYDSIIRQNLGLPNRAIGSPDRIVGLQRDYDEIQGYLDQQVRTPQFSSLRERFDETFPEYQHFTDVKVLDFMIWQIRA